MRGAPHLVNGLLFLNLMCQFTHRDSLKLRIPYQIRGRVSEECILLVVRFPYGSSVILLLDRAGVLHHQQATLM